ncbi:hypothetical protein GCM10023403_10780 [Pseudonocardia benzenivorans]|uniref:hypothetical protein n=1 Tax=Pseudonocardia benzenivorans TaxID=228005 RepID=UPI0031F8D333
MSDWTQLIGAISSAIVAIIGAIAAAIVAIKRVSPKERGKAVEEAAKPSVDEAQSREIEDLRRKLEELTGGAADAQPEES